MSASEPGGTTTHVLYHVLAGSERAGRSASIMADHFAHTAQPTQTKACRDYMCRRAAERVVEELLALRDLYGMRVGPRPPMLSQALLNVGQPADGGACIIVYSWLIAGEFPAVG